LQAAKGEKQKSKVTVHGNGVENVEGLRGFISLWFIGLYGPLYEVDCLLSSGPYKPINL
jgi:hypothetical protein